MPDARWVRGSALSAELRAQVLSAYGYRWTVENERRARQWYGKIKGPTIPLVTDEAWLHAQAFAVTQRGTLDRRVRFTRPAYLAGLA